MALIPDTGSSNSIAGATPRQINSSTSLVVPTFSAVAYSHVRVTDNQVEPPEPRAISMGLVPRIQDRAVMHGIHLRTVSMKSALRELKRARPGTPSWVSIPIFPALQ